MLAILRHTTWILFCLFAVSALAADDDQTSKKKLQQMLQSYPELAAKTARHVYQKEKELGNPQQAMEAADIAVQGMIQTQSEAAL